MMSFVNESNQIPFDWPRIHTLRLLLLLIVLFDGVSNGGGKSDSLNSVSPIIECVHIMKGSGFPASAEARKNLDLVLTCIKSVGRSSKCKRYTSEMTGVVVE